MCSSDLTVRAARDDVLATTIPAATEVELMALHRAPVPVTAPLSPAALAYERLWGELSGRGYTATTQQAVRERASTSVTTGPPPKEQPPRKLSGTEDRSAMASLESNVLGRSPSE